MRNCCGLGFGAGTLDRERRDIERHDIVPLFVQPDRARACTAAYLERATTRDEALLDRLDEIGFRFAGIPRELVRSVV